MSEKYVMEPSKPPKASKVPREKKEPKSPSQKPSKLQQYGKVGEWFQTICLMKIPVFGFFYTLVVALRKKTPPYKKTFALAYLLYKILVLVLALTVIYVLYRVGLGFLDELLQYAS